MRLRHTLFQGFPGCVSRVACLAVPPPPPSSNRTCGFPAHFRRDCCPGLRRQLRHRRPQGSPAQPLVVLVRADSRRHSIRSLAASLQVLPETDWYVMVDPGKSCAGVAKAKVVGPASQGLVQLQNQPRRGCRGMFPVNSRFASIRLHPAHPVYRVYVFPPFAFLCALCVLCGELPARSFAADFRPLALDLRLSTSGFPLSFGILIAKENLDAG